MGVTPIDYHISTLNHFVWLAFRQRPLYLHVQGKNQEQVNSKLDTFSWLIHSFIQTHAGNLLVYESIGYESCHVQTLIYLHHQRLWWGLKKSSLRTCWGLQQRQEANKSPSCLRSHSTLSLLARSFLRLCQGCPMPHRCQDRDTGLQLHI